MRAVLRRRHAVMQLTIIIVFSVVLLAVIWKVFVTADEIKAKEFQVLAEIPPDVIIRHQQKNPGTWKDYAAVVYAFDTGIKNLDPADKQAVNVKLLDGTYELTRITEQLDHNVAFKRLNWNGISAEARKRALYCRRLLDKHRVYDDQKYAFPFNESCYFTDTFGADREGGKRRHEGTDLFNKKGTPVLNVCSGTVEKLGWNRLGGERVGVRADDGNYYYYAHLDTINPDLAAGKRILKGELIATMGNTGDAISTPDHLHFGIELPNGEWLNPYAFLKVWDYQKFGAKASSNA